MQLLMLALSFMKIGAFGFGGGLAILPLIFQEVDKFGHMSADEISNLVAISQVTPGPIAINAATFVGFNAHGVAGALTATLSVAFPGLVLVMLATYFLEKFKGSTIMQGILTGIRPASCGLVFAAALLVAKGCVLVLPVNVFAIIVFIAALILSLTVKASPILLIIISGVLGAVLYGFVI